MQTLGEESNNNKIAKNKVTYKLAMLNDDCLQHMVKKLELIDQLHFSLACQRFKNIFEMACKTEYKKVYFDRLWSLTFREVREFFLVAGPYVEALMGAVPYKGRDRFIEFIGTFCTNVKHINFYSSALKYSTLLKLFEKLQTCTVVELPDCSLDDDAILALEKLPKLEFLSVAKNYTVTGQYIARFTTVKVLDLHGCYCIKPSHFIEIIRSLKNLQSLDIQDCLNLLEDASREMLKHCRNLESLKISSPALQYKCIALLPSLKNLEILPESEAPLHTQLFELLAEHKAETLESLNIFASNRVNFKSASHIGRIINLKQFSCLNNVDLTDDCLHKLKELKNLEEIVLKDCRSITNEGLLQLVKSCTKLKKVNVEGCVRITDQFVLKVIQVLESTQSERGEGPCVFFVAEPGVNRNMIYQNDYMTAADCGLLKIYFYKCLDKPFWTQSDDYDAADEFNVGEFDIADMFG